MKEGKLTYNDIYNTIREYHWMLPELIRLKKQFADFENDQCIIVTESNRRKKKWRRMKDFERQIEFIDRQTCITKESDKVILDALLDGETIKSIAKAMQMDRKTIERTRQRIVMKLVESQD